MARGAVLCFLVLSRQACGLFFIVWAMVLSPSRDLGWWGWVKGLHLRLCHHFVVTDYM